MARQLIQFQVQNYYQWGKLQQWCQKEKKGVGSKNVGSTMNGDIKTSGNDDNTN